MNAVVPRRNLRVAWRLPCQLADRSGGTPVSGTTYDLSVGGALVFVEAALPEGRRVTMRFQTSFHGATRSFALDARVVRGIGCQDGLLAIAFDQLESDELEGLREAVFARALAQVRSLGEFPAFWDLGDLELLTLASVCHEQSLAVGSSLPLEGETQRSAFLLRRGAVQMRQAESRVEDGYEVVGPGSVFGESAVLLGTPHGLEVVALQPTELIVVARGAIEHLRDQDPRLALMLLEVFAREFARRTTCA